MLVGIVASVESQNTDITDCSDDTALIQFFQSKRSVVKTTNSCRGFAECLGSGNVTGRTAHNSYAAFGEVGKLVNLDGLIGQDQLMSQEVGLGEIDNLFALVGNRNTGHDDVAVAFIDSRENAFPRCVDELNVKTFGLCDGTHQINVETDKLFLRCFIFEGTISRTCSDDILFSINTGGSSQCDCSACCPKQLFHQHLIDSNIRIRHRVYVAAILIIMPQSNPHWAAFQQE